MSKIAIVIAAAPNPAPTLAALRRLLPDTSLAEFRERLSAGAPIVEEKLFGNDYPEVAERILGLMEALPDTGAELRYFELEPDEDFDAAADLTLWEITPETVRNILDSAKSYESDAIDAEAT